MILVLHIPILTVMSAFRIHKTMTNKSLGPQWVSIFITGDQINVLIMASYTYKCEYCLNFKLQQCGTFCHIQMTGAHEKKWNFVFENGDVTANLLLHTYRCADKLVVVRMPRDVSHAGPVTIQATDHSTSQDVIN